MHTDPMLVFLRKPVVLLSVLVLLAFGRSIWGSFHFDDTHTLVENVAVHSIVNIPKFWTDPSTSSFIVENQTYRPLTYTFFALNWALGGGSPVPFKVFKLFLHLLVALGIYQIWKNLWSLPGWLKSNQSPETASLILAGLFAVHPACSECVNYIAATSSLQCAAFYVWAYCYYLAFRESRSVRDLLVSLLLYFLSVASKEEGITLPAVVAMTELYLSAGSLRERIRRSLQATLPYLGLGLILGGWIYFMHPAYGDISRGTRSSFSYFITQWRAYLWYMRLWFWPTDLNADNWAFEFSESLWDRAVLRALFANLSLLWIGFALRRRFPSFLFGLLWFYISISPASSVVVLGEAVNEHRMYLAYVGFAGGSFAIVLSVLKWLSGFSSVSRVLPLVYLGVFGALLMGSQARSLVWANDLSLWTDTVRKNPTSGRALNNLALVYIAEGNFEKAIEIVDQCEKVWPGYMYCILNRGLGYLALAEKDRERGDSQRLALHLREAQGSLERAIYLNPLNVHSNYHLGRYFQDFKGDCVKARPYYESAIRLSGNKFPNAQAKLSLCYQGLNQIQEAEAVIKKAYELEPDNELVLSVLGDQETSRNHLDQALVHYQRLIKIYPDKPSGFVGGANVALARKDYSAALEFLKKWVSLRPDSIQALVYLGAVLKKLGESAALAEVEKKYFTIRPVKGEFNLQLSALEQTSVWK